MKTIMMTDYKTIVESYIEEHKNEGFKLLSALIRQPSIQGQEHGAQEVLIKYLKSLPCDLDVWDIDPAVLKSSPYFIESRQNFKGRPNLAATFKGTGNGKSILLNGHIDVVPPGDLNQWTDDPYSGIIRDGKMYGRGTTDMKGGTLSLLMAIESIVKSRTPLKGDMIFESVIEEESGGAGTLSATLRGVKADIAMIPEPTNLKLFVKQQGSMWFRVTITGLSAHGGTRYEGVSAIEKAWIIHRAILELESQRNARFEDPLFSHIPIPLPINVGKLQSGNWPSSVPDVATMEGRIGVGPEETLEQVKEELEKCLESAGSKDDWLSRNRPKLEIFGGQWLPNGVSQEHPMVGLLGQEYRRLFGRNLIVEASPWGTDAGMLKAAGDIPALVIGPGETKIAHYPDEYIVLENIVKAAKLFASVIIEWCGVN